MKTFDKKDIFSWSNAEEAKQYIGRQGYFGDSIAELNNKIQGAFKNILTDVFTGDTDRASIPFGNDDEEAWSLFLLADKVKEVEKTKKYQPFKTFEEFKACTHKDVGDVIVFKEKNAESINTALVTGYHGSCLHKLGLGYMGYSFQELFYDYLWLDTNNNWKTFGVLDENN